MGGRARPRSAPRAGGLGEGAGGLGRRVQQLLPARPAALHVLVGPAYLGQCVRLADLGLQLAACRSVEQVGQRLLHHLAATEDLKGALVEANEGRPVDVVLEMSGGRVFDQCAEALAPFGRIVAYGIAGREQNTLETGRLMRKSRAVIGFWLMHCLGRRDMMEEPLADLFDRAARGELVPQLGNTYGMSEVRQAHEDLQGRRTSGKLLLDPSR